MCFEMKMQMYAKSNNVLCAHWEIAGRRRGIFIDLFAFVWARFRVLFGCGFGFGPSREQTIMMRG